MNSSAPRSRPSTLIRPPRTGYQPSASSTAAAAPELGTQPGRRPGGFGRCQDDDELLAHAGDLDIGRRHHDVADLTARHPDHDLLPAGLAGACRAILRRPGDREVDVRVDGRLVGGPPADHPLHLPARDQVGAGTHLLCVATGHHGARCLRLGRAEQQRHEKGCPPGPSDPDHATASLVAGPPGHPAA